jgi:hypothetical protein
MPPHNALLTIARDSMEMSQRTGDRRFTIMAMVMMAVAGIGTIMHTGYMLYRDMAGRRDDRGRGRDNGEGSGRSEHEDTATRERHERERDGEPDRKWTRGAEGEQERYGQARRR